MSAPVFDVLRFPKDEREWGRALLALNTWVRRSRDRVFAKDQRFLNQISAAGKRSTQSVQPLSSTDSGGGLASISIAAHTVQYGFGTVAYNSGTITGLSNSTLEYVYVDDPDYLGGAVTYSATTNPNIATANSSRYYVGKITTDAPAGGGSQGGYGGGGGGGGNPLP